MLLLPGLGGVPSEFGIEQTWQVSDHRERSVIKQEAKGRGDHQDIADAEAAVDHHRDPVYGCWPVRGLQVHTPPQQMS
ncbi:hypothetical protein CCP3SC15_80036 [Gammaproteobacteria bacterium]